MSNSISDLSLNQLKRAVTIREKIAKLEKELASILGAPSTPATKLPKKKRRMSAAGRASIRRAQLARWALIKAAKKKK